MIQIECFNSEYSLNGWLREHTQYCIRDIKPIVSNDHYHCRFMVIYEDNTIETEEVIEKLRETPVSVLPADKAISTALYGDYSIYLNG